VTELMRGLGAAAARGEAETRLWMVAFGAGITIDPVFPGGGFDSFLRGLGCSMFHPMIFVSASCDALTRVGKRVWRTGVRGTLVDARWSRGGEEEKEEGLKTRRR
jgi:hypothetical protein